MLRILIADGTPAAMQAEREPFGIPSNASLFEAALRSQQPHIRCSSINVADGQDLPSGVSLGDFDGLMFSGSPLRYLRSVPRSNQANRFCAGSVYGGRAYVGKLLGSAACDRSTRRNRPPQPPWPRAWGGQGNYHHGRWPLPPAYGYAAFGFRRSLLSYRRTRTAAARRGSPGTERAFSNSGAGGGTAIGRDFLRDAIPSRVHAVGLSRIDRHPDRKSRSGRVRS